MKIQKIKSNTIKIAIPPNSRCPILTSDALYTHHVNFIAVGKRNSGKSILITNYLRMLKLEGKLHRLFIISPTIESNRALIDSLGVRKEDIYDPEESSTVHKIMAEIDAERDRYVIELKRVQKYKQFEKALNSDIPIEMINPELLLEFAEYLNGSVIEKPKLHYGERPFLHIFIDDCQSTKIFRSVNFNHLCIRSRHLGIMPYEKNNDEMCGALGASMYIAVQNFKCTGGGLSRGIRNNATQIAVCGKSKDLQELGDIFQSIGGEVDEEQFMQAYEFATAERYGSLVIDLHKKDSHPSMFRKNFDEFIIVD